MIQLFASGGQSIVTSASILPMSSQCWFPLGLTALIPLQFKGLKSLLQHYSSKTSIILDSTFFIVQIPHPCTAIGKTIPWLLPAKGCLWFHMLSWFVIPFPERNKCLLNSCLQSPSPYTVILEDMKIKIFHSFHLVLIYLLSRDGRGWHDLNLLNVEVWVNLFNLHFHLSKEL